MATTLTTVSLANTPVNTKTEALKDTVYPRPNDGLGPNSTFGPLPPGSLPEGSAVYENVVADFRVTYDNPLQPSSIPQTNRFTCDADPSLYSSVVNPEFEWVAVKNCIPYNPLYDPNLPIFGVSDPMDQQVAQVMNIDGFPLDPPGGPVMDNGPVVIGLKVTDKDTGDENYREYTYSSAGVLIGGPAGNVYPPTVRWRAARRNNKTFAFRNNSRPGSNPIASYTIYYGDGQEFTYSGANAESTNPGVNGRHHYKIHGVYDVVVVMTDTLGQEGRATLTVHTDPDPRESVPSFEVGLQMTNVPPPPEFEIVDDNPGGVDNGNTTYLWYQVQFTNDGLAGDTAQTQEDKNNQNIRRTPRQATTTLEWAFYLRPSPTTPQASFVAVDATRVAYRIQDIVNNPTLDHWTVIATSPEGARYLVNRALDREDGTINERRPTLEITAQRQPGTKEVTFTPRLNIPDTYAGWTFNRVTWVFDTEYMRAIQEEGDEPDPDYQASLVRAGGPNLFGQESFVYNLYIPNEYLDDEETPSHNKKVRLSVTLRNPNPPAGNIPARYVVKGYFVLPVREWLWPNPVAVFTHTGEPTGVVPFRGTVFLGCNDQSVRNVETRANISSVKLTVVAMGKKGSTSTFDNEGTCIVYDQYRRQIDREQGVPAAQVNYFPQEYQNASVGGDDFSTEWVLRYDRLTYYQGFTFNELGPSNRNNDDWARFRNEWGTPLTRPLGAIVPPEGTRPFRRRAQNGLISLTLPQPAWDEESWNKFYSTSTNPANGRSITGNGYRPSFPMQFTGCGLGDQWWITYEVRDVLGERCGAWGKLEVQDDMRYGAAAQGQFTFSEFNNINDNNLLETWTLNRTALGNDYEYTQPTYEPLDPAGIPPNPDDDVIVQPVPSPPPTP